MTDGAKAHRKALLTVRHMSRDGGRLHRDTGGDAQLRGAIDSFSRQREQRLNQPANGSQSAALGLGENYSNPPQLAVAEPPQQQRSNSKDMAQQTTDFGSALDDGIGMLTGRDTTKPAAKAASAYAPTPMTGGAGAAPSASATPTGGPRVPYNGSLTPQDRDLLIRTVAGEAGNQGAVGQAAVAHVILNRAMDSRFGKNGVSGVILAPLQFSTWNKGDPAGDMARALSPDSKTYQSIGKVVDGTVTGDVPDPTNGATNFYAPAGGYGMKAGTVPSWAGPLASQNDVTIGGHRFLGKSNFDLQQPAQSAAQQPPQPPADTPAPPAPQPPPPAQQAASTPPHDPFPAAFDPNDTEDMHMPGGSKYVSPGPVAIKPLSEADIPIDQPPDQAKRGGIVKRAEGGVASTPTPELIAKALQIIARRKAATGGKQTTAAASTPAASTASTPATQQAYQPFTGQTALSNPGDELMNIFSGYDAAGNPDIPGAPGDSQLIGADFGGGVSMGGTSPAAAATPAPITPALDGQTIGNASAGGAGLGTVPMATPGGGVGMGGGAATGGGGGGPPPSGAGAPPIPQPSYNNTLDEALGTNSPTMNQVFGFNYPVPPAPKPQPQGPVSQDQINAEYGVGDGSQIGTGVFASGGAIIMDALTRANRQRKAKGKR